MEIKTTLGSNAGELRETVKKAGGFWTPARKAWFGRAAPLGAPVRRYAFAMGSKVEIW